MIDIIDYTNKMMDVAQIDDLTDRFFIHTCIELMNTTIFKDVTDIEIEMGIRTAVAMFLSMMVCNYD